METKEETKKHWKNFDDLTGRRFGRLVVIEEAERNKCGTVRWLCKCDCGNMAKVQAGSLRNGHSTSCGCFGAEQRKKANTIHGLHKHPLRGVFSAMKGRCLNCKDKVFDHYGGRGITVCPEWRDDFIKFYEWAMENGWKKGLEIDRRNNDGDYCPENCWFVTRRLNVQNKRQLKRGKAGYLGVTISKSGNRFRAKYAYKGKPVHVGYFATPQEAAIARYETLKTLDENYWVDPAIKDII